MQLGIRDANPKDKVWNPNYKGVMIMMKRAICYDCGVKEGQIHQFDCPFCGKQLMTCSCRYIKLGFDYKEPIWNRTTNSWSPEKHPTNGLPKDIYENGLTKELTEKCLQIDPE